MLLAVLLASATAARLPPIPLQHASGTRATPLAGRPAVFARTHVNLLGIGGYSSDPLVSLYKVDGGQCGEALVRMEIVPFAQQFAGLRRGDCASLGFDKPVRARTIVVPVVGSIRVALYTSG
jgi:hypothetical protein